ncbi:MAG: esterase-like activity of phytase family protein, partial [Stellaceae bacterium]
MSARCKRWLAAGVFITAFALVIGSFALAEGLHYADAQTPIAIIATPIEAFDNRDPARTRFGALEFRGGLALTSSYDAFGGVSAINVDADGSHFLAITDNGSWLRGRILYRNGRPSGIADAEMAPILGADGTPLAAHGWFDVESLTELGGLRYIGIERVEKIVRFNVTRDGLQARGEPIPVPADFKTFTFNKSLECLAAGPEGSP